MATQDMMSPVRHKAKPEPSPLTPGTLRVSSIQPSPNRTEAAAAMMNLLTGNSSGQATKTCPALKPSKAKRRYVRRVPKKVGTSAKRQIKTALMDTDAVTAGKPPVKAAARTPEDGDKNGDWRMDGDEVRFFPFREYNRKEKSLGLLCENFLKLYRDDKIAEICLDRAATELGVERRRIYDIVNILESVHLVSRKSKNLYNWHGLASLPKSIGDMKQRYAEAQKASSPTSSSAEYPPIKSDRRRGKSLSKLSQMFVQLFLGKEDCIIPLDQAAKQLIQMEDSESEEDRLLKTKIRRLYDVANVLVSVGLIEKLQLSNSRKPVFRWKTRSSSSDPSPFNGSDSEQKFADDVKKTPTSASTVDVKTHTDARMDDTDGMKSPQSCDSDLFDEGSDSQSDTSSCGSKRKQGDQEGSDVSMSDGETSAKRSKLGEGNRSPQATPEKSVGLLRMDADNEPIPPQIIFCEQQEQVKLYMQQYIREYAEYLAAHQKLPQTKTTAGQVGLVTPSCSKPGAIAAITKGNHGTPISLPTLAGSIQELLLSESPQSVADLFAARVLSNSRPPITTSSPVAAEPEAETNPRPLILSATKQSAYVAKTPSAIASTPSAPEIKAETSTSKDEEELYDAPRNLIMALQQRSQ